MDRQEQIDRKICGFITFHFVMSGVLWLFSGITFLQGYGAIVSAINWLVFFTWLANIASHIKNRSRRIAIRSYSIFAVLYLLSIVLSLLRDQPLDILLKHDILWTFVYYLPLGLAAFSVKNYTILYEMLYKYSFIITFCCTAVFVNHMLNPFNTYDMTFGYVLLIPTTLHLSWFFNRKHSIVLIVIAILEIVMLLLYGSRGVFVSIAVFFALRFYFFGKRINKGVVIIGVIAVGAFFSYGAPMLLNDYLESQGIYSRTLMAFIDPEYNQTGDREDHWGTGVSLIVKNPIIGYGLGGYYYDFQEVLVKEHPDQQYIYDPIEQVYNKSVATYAGCHSGFLDLLVSFGVLVGLPIALWLIFSIFKVDKRADRNYLELLLLFYSTNIAPNMIISSGLHYKPGCAIYIFLFLYYLQSRKQRAVINKNKELIPKAPNSDAVNS